MQRTQASCHSAGPVYSGRGGPSDPSVPPLATTPVVRALSLFSASVAGMAIRPIAAEVARLDPEADAIQSRFARRCLIF